MKFSKNKLLMAAVLSVAAISSKAQAKTLTFEQGFINGFYKTCHERSGDKEMCKDVSQCISKDSSLMRDIKKKASKLRKGRSASQVGLMVFEDKKINSEFMKTAERCSKKHY